MVFKRLLMVALLLSVFGLSAFGVMYFALRGRTVDVPNVTGKSEAEAFSELEDLGLRMEIKSRGYNPQAPANAVTDQYPKPGTTVKTGQIVRVSLSLGAGKQN